MNKKEEIEFILKWRKHNLISLKRLVITLKHRRRRNEIFAKTNL